MTFPVICLAGPTGAGKTAAALLLARELRGEIVNADSRQVYADIPVITAQPEAAELAAAPHHLYGFLPCTAAISAGQWLELARKACQGIRDRGRLPVFVGGTGLYFESLLHGLSAMPAVPADVAGHFAARLQAEGPAALHAELARVDPAYAARIHPHDRQRVRRALEIYAASGRPFSWWHSQGRQKPLARGPLLVMDCSLAWLEPRLKARIGAMLAKGALAEAVRARDAGQGAAPAFNGIGVRELMAHLAGAMDLDACRQAWLAATRAYAKRQLTWFRGRAEAIWIPPDRPEALLAAARAWLAGAA